MRRNRITIFLKHITQFYEKKFPITHTQFYEAIFAVGVVTANPKSNFIL
jgi:hypothetical protein